MTRRNPDRMCHVAQRQRLGQMPLDHREHLGQQGFAAASEIAVGDAIPRLLRSVGFDCSVVGSRPHRLIGRLTFYRATRLG